MRAGCAPSVFAALSCLAGAALAAPDEEVLGKAQGYPLCERRSVWERHCLVGTASRFDEIFDVRKVAKPPVARPLKRAAEEPWLRYAHDREIRSVDEYLARNRTTGFLILKDDTILVERYQYERKPEHRMNSFSVVKTLVGLLVGIAIAEKRIASIDDRAEIYVPALKGTPFGETPIRHLLTMSSGIKFVEGHDDPASDDVVLGGAALGGQSAGGVATVAPFRTRVRAPGVRFNYSSADTQVLGLILRAATGTNLSEYLSQKIWQPMGTEDDAYWTIDRGGYETAYGFLSARVRDWARLGLLLANDGALDGRQIILAAWLRETTTVQAEHLRRGTATPNFGYGYQVWVLPGKERRFVLSGVRGQAVYVDPASKLVMVHTGVRETREPGYGEQNSLWMATVIRFSAPDRQ